MFRRRSYLLVLDRVAGPRERYGVPGNERTNDSDRLLEPVDPRRGRVEVTSDARVFPRHATGPQPELDRPAVTRRCSIVRLRQGTLRRSNRRDCGGLRNQGVQCVGQAGEGR